MAKISSKSIRQQFIEFFKNKGHSIIRSSSVVPNDDPTLLFTNAGMNQFKPIFLDTENPKSKRAVNSQKCIRVSGKHNDLEEVGVDDYHHTFFEMLGNWSFGDYYKKEAIQWAWELLTKVWKMDKNRLWVTIFQDDDEAGELWKEVTDIDPKRILKFGHKDNFWEMGETGPCGPCSEIHYYTGEDADAQIPEGVNRDHNYREIWNLVFIQYNRDADGKLTDLPAKHVDTGAGLERIVAILNGKTSNYDTDLFMPIIEKISQISNTEYSIDDGVPHRVIADHLRMLAFSIADGAMPGNEGRGYVLRRVLRRASRYGRILDMHEPFIYKLIQTLVEVMGDAFSELAEKQSHIEKVIKAEETSFGSTLDKGIEIFEKISQGMKTGESISGEDAFKLYDTYGFPCDLTELMAREIGLSVDTNGFESCMDVQKKSSREAGGFTHQTDNFDWTDISKGTSSEFVGYEQTACDSIIRKIQFENDKKGSIILDKTPFYPEQGGQVGDVGILKNTDFEFIVTDTQKSSDEIVHFGKIMYGKLPKDGKVTATIDNEYRQKISLNHTTTHLLHQGLKQILGDHAHQSGSLVGSDRFRFDVTHYERITLDEIRQIEVIVNSKIRENIEVSTDVKDYETARSEGAVALFGEKYGDKVRMVNISDFSKELCGGTHANRTGDIGAFKIISESALAAGIRRIEAITGNSVIKYLHQNEEIIQQAKNLFKCSETDIPEKIQQTLDQKKSLEKENKELKLLTQSDVVDDLISKAHQFGDVRLVVTKIDEIDDLKAIGDEFRQKFKQSGIALIGTVKNDKPMVMCAITDDLTNNIQAGKVVKEVGEKIGGGGGGKPHLATAGGRNSDSLQSALDFGETYIKAKIDFFQDNRK
ncbi:MAG: alanine--tRNA ligase [Candidatus Marinimicrobia bacterium]|nr:alanine--tRNA ligase [Candidatus Neomarinimicrobiota bacterium]MBL7023355.1 alanine--tRNA ligase [Candidatus Neomarinimicrobiota bacterium]MBL7109314.1 alanine--tRNA ligase [Candidatus Neomarinimicrobiota bacterium]